MKRAEELFAASTVGSSTSTDTISAALNIAHHPGLNVAAIFGLAAANTPFQPTLAAAPYDWTMSISYSEFIKFYTSSAMDAEGNFWWGSYYQSC